MARKSNKQQAPRTEEEARAALEAIIQQHHPIFNGGDLLDTLFDKQRAFHDDPAKNKAALCSRRAGKSRSSAVAMIKAAQKYPNSMVPYIALTRQSARNIMWPAIEEMNRIYGLGLEPKESSLEWKVPVGNTESTLFMVGADQKNFIERLRGPKYPLAIIDEAQGFRSHIEHLVEDVLEPAVADYSGEVWLLGTPGAVPTGYFYDVTTNPQTGYSTHHWTVLDNPYFPNAKAYLDNLKQRKSWDDSHPTFRREWLGEWCFDPSALIYKLNDYNLCKDFEDNADWHYVLGIDVGWHDKTAFAVLAYSTDNPITYVVQVDGYSELIPSEIADYTKMMIDNYEPTNIVMDTGGLGKSIAEEMRRRFDIPIEAAEKKDKMATIELLNGDLQRNYLRVFKDNVDLIHQMHQLQKADNGLEDPNLPNDYCDATLYAWRKCKQYAYQEEKLRVDVNDPSWGEKWAEQYEQKMLRQQNEQAILEDWNP